MGSGGKGSPRPTAGARPKPIEIHKRNGNPGRRPENALEPLEVPRERPDPPEHFADERLIAWHYFVDAIQAMGILATTDAMSIEALCNSWVNYRKAEMELNLQGFTAESAKGEVKVNPTFQVRAKLHSEVMGLLSQFGFTPVARAIIVRNFGPQKKESENPLDAIMRKRMEREARDN